VTEVASSLGTEPLPLVWSKLQVPVVRHSIARHALLERLSGTGCRLALVRAPAGWGKSTLMARWRASAAEERPFAWLALDEQDNDPVQFWTYVIESLRAVVPALGESSRVLARTPGLRHAEVTVRVLVNELAAAEQPLVFVLDDFHVVTHTDIHDGVVRLLRHLPAGTTLAIATRTEPPLPLARLRAAGDLVEIDAADLSFTPAEAEEFFTALHGLALDPDQAARLRDRAEGWAAGLYLATLSLRDRHDRWSVDAFIDAFAGDDRNVVDYLSEQVLRATAADTLTFLRRTSILQRLSAPLCDAVTGGTGSAVVLEEIARSNAFLIPLDTRMEWYRYHHLFSDLLRRELDRAEPAVIPSLHRRAADWLLADGSVSDAIHHLVAAGDAAEASRLVSEHWRSYRDQNRQETVLGWLDGLRAAALDDADQASDGGVLSLVRAASLIELGRLTPEVEAALDAAERAVGDDDASWVSGAVHANRAILLYQRGDVGRILATVPRALDRPAARDPYWRCVLLTVLGAAQLLAARREDAARTLSDAVTVSTAAGHVLAQTHSLGWRAAARYDVGEHARARDDLVRIEQLCRDRPDLREYYGQTVARVVRGWMEERDDDPGAAQTTMAEAVELAARGSSHLQLGYAMLARVELADLVGRRDLAVEHLRESRSLLATCPDPGVMAGRADRLADRLLRTGTRVGAGIDALTARELEVARLVTARRTNAQIAAELHVSRKTVETHVRNIFAKLDVTSRVAVAHAVEAADRAARRVG
jgi:LuxR family maltose regulon positive regulatory protein